VISLFTNVPVDLALDILKEKWSHIHEHTSLPKNEFISATKFVLQSTFFHFNNKYYKQTFGAPRGSLLSPIVADLVLQKLESQIINNLVIKPNFYYRYVDDIALSAPLSCLKDLHDSFNSFHPRIKFTMELGGEKLNFFRSHYNEKRWQIVFQLISQTDFLRAVSEFLFPTPFHTQRKHHFNLIDRVILLSHLEFHEENFDCVIRVLLNNEYQLDLIFFTIRRRLHSMINRKFHNRKELVKNSSYFVIPYVSTIAKKFIKYFKNISFCKLAFSCYDQLNKFIKVHKDTLPSLSRSNVVYKINCLNCDASYVGQTKRTLNTRVAEHRNHIRKDTAQVSVITDHRLQSNHEFDWGEGVRRGNKLQKASYFRNDLYKKTKMDGIRKTTLNF